MNAIISYKSLKTGSRKWVRNPTQNEDEQTQIPKKKKKKENT